MKYTLKIFHSPRDRNLKYSWEITAEDDNEKDTYSSWNYTLWGAKRDAKKKMKLLKKPKKYLICEEEIVE